MPNRNIERLAFTEVLVAGVTELARVPVNPAGTSDVAAKRLIGVSADVRVAADGTGTLAIGNSVDPDGYMTTANVGLGVAGRKEVAAGALAVANMNGIESATEIQLEITYTAGTDGNAPEVEIVFLLMEVSAYNDLMAGLV